MYSFLRTILLTAHCLLLFVVANSQVSFYSTVSSNEIHKDELLNYRLVIENLTNIQSINHPAFTDFLLLTTPTTMNGVHSINGQVTKYMLIDYTLKPKRPGKFTIGQAMATIGNKIYKTNTITIVVKNSRGNALQNQLTGIDPSLAQRPLSDFKDYIFYKGDSLREKISKNMDFRVETDKGECYVGEPIVASYRLYTRLKTESRLTQSPSFTGFSVVYMQDPGDFGNNAKGKLNGRDCNVLTIRKAQLYALQPGEINLESAELENNVQFIRESYANQMADAGRVFDDFPTSIFPADAVLTQDVTLKTKPLIITVKPLPEKDKPALFKGAVGNFSIEASLQKPVFSTDEAGKLSVVISGNGNMQLLTSPEIEWPKGIESFEPAITDKLVKETVPVSGSKKFEYSFAADDSGQYTLAPIHFSYFDPSTATYKTIATQPIVFQITKGTGHPPDFARATAQNEQPSFINNIFNHRWWIVIFIAGLVITGLIIWLISDKKREVASVPGEEHVHEDAINQIIEIAAVNQQNVFSETEKCLYADDCFGFYSLLNTELRNYLASRFSIDANTINSNSIVPILDKQAVSNDIVLKLQRLMQNIEWQLYTPFERNEKMNELYQEAHEVVQMINTGDFRPR